MLQVNLVNPINLHTRILANLVDPSRPIAIQYPPTNHQNFGPGDPKEGTPGPLSGGPRTVRITTSSGPSSMVRLRQFRSSQQQTTSQDWRGKWKTKGKPRKLELVFPFGFPREPNPTKPTHTHNLGLSANRTPPKMVAVSLI